MALIVEGTHRKDFGVELAENAGQRQRRRRMRVVDHHPVGAAADALGVPRVEQTAHVRLHGAVREFQLAELAVEGAPEVLAPVVLLDVLLALLAEVDARRFEHLDLDHLGVPARDAHVQPALGAPGLGLVRLMALLATRRSRTITPVELRPQISALLMTREAGCASRLVVMRAPFLSTVRRPSRA